MADSVRSVVVRARTLEEAIEVALRDLGAERALVEVEVLEGGASGVSDGDPGSTQIRATLRTAGDADVSSETSSTEGRASVSPGDVGAQVLRQTFAMLGLSCEVASRAGDEAGDIVLEVSGPDSAAAIGREGEVLDALEHVVNRIAHRDAYGTGRISVDAEGLRDHRQRALGELARRLADEVRESGRPVTMEPMTARDRRAVHLSLREDTGVTTRSEGEGRFRRLVIAPVGAGQPAS